MLAYLGIPILILLVFAIVKIINLARRQKNARKYEN